MNLQQAFWKQLKDGFVRSKSATKPSLWAETYRHFSGGPFPGPWRFKYHPWLREMHDSKADENVGQKAAQLGYTELMMNIAFYNIDVLRRNVMYFLPKKTPDATDFSTTRFDPALEDSLHLRNLFSQTKNVSVKRAGGAALYVRGAQSRSALKSVPAGVILADEVDEMIRENVILMWERVSGQKEYLIWMISTPSIENHGINKYYKESTQELFKFKCPGCSKYIDLDYPRNLSIPTDDPDDPEVYNSFLHCHKCGKVLEHEAKSDFLESGIFVPSTNDYQRRGFYVNQLYSSAKRCHPGELGRFALQARYDPLMDQEWHNSKLGRTHRAKGINVQAEDVANAMHPYNSDLAKSGCINTIGIDVGKHFHYEISKWTINKRANADITDDATCVVTSAGKVETVEEILAIMKDNNLTAGVIDALPETRLSLYIAQQMYGRMKLCFFNNWVAGKDLKFNPEKEFYVDVNRTFWFDIALSRFRTGMIKLPADIDHEYKYHMTVPTKRYENVNGRVTSKYITADNTPDHYALARVYNEIAFKLAASGMYEVQSINKAH